MAVDDFVMTIDSDVEDAPPPPLKKSRSDVAVTEEAQLDPDFVFDLTGDPYSDLLEGHLDVHDLVKKGSKPVRYTFVDF